MGAMKTTTLCGWSVLSLALVAPSACATAAAQAPDTPAQELQAEAPAAEGTPPEAEPPARAQDPRARAAQALVAQGRDKLAAGQVDAALSDLERAVGLDPSGGEAYYWMAEAWLRSGDRDQAEQYHDQAQRYLRDSPTWQGKLERQADRIRALAPAPRRS